MVVSTSGRRGFGWEWAELGGGRGKEGGRGRVLTGDDDVRDLAKDRNTRSTEAEGDFGRPITSEDQYYYLIHQIVPHAENCNQIGIGKGPNVR